MRNNYISIMDKSGKAFSLYVSTPGNGALIWNAYTKGRGENTWGSWKSMTVGYIRYFFGKTRTRHSNNGDASTGDLLFLSPDGAGISTYDDEDRFGIQLFEYEDFLGVNDEGEGTVVQPWVIGLTPGRIRWEKISS